MSDPPGPSVRPPRLARWLLGRVVPGGPARDGLIGDLDELWQEKCEEAGRAVAGLWYWTEVSHATLRYAVERGRRWPTRRAGAERNRRAGLMEALVRDLRFALRTLRRTPGFALTAVLTLALGIAGTTAIFTVVDTVLLRPPPYAEPGRLVNVWTTYPHWRGEESLDAFWDRIALSYPEYEDWHSGSRLFTSTAAYTMRGSTLRGEGAAERLTVGVGTASLLEVLGVQPALGRWFLPGEDRGGRRVVVLSDGLWKRRFGGDRSVLGRTITLDEEPFTVIGVLPAGFALKNVFVPGDDGDHAAWLPIGRAGDLTRRGNHSFDAIGRLAAGASMEAALAEATPLLRGDSPPERRGVRMMLRPEVEVGALRSPLLLLLAASTVLLLIACANVAVMLVGESLGRRAEMATRAALGAGRGRIVRQLVTESVVLGLAGALVGTLGALLLTRLIAVIGPALPVAREIAVRPRILWFACGLGLVTGVLFGLAPAVALRRVGLREAMQRGTRGRGRFDRGLQNGVVAFEIALTVILMVGGGLLTRSVLNLFAVDPGFRTDRLAVVEVSATAPRFTAESAAMAYARAIPLLEAVPGVSRASGVTTLPLSGSSSSTSLDIEGLPPAADGSPGPEAQRRVVFDGYHEVMGIPLVAGRFLTAADGPDAPLAMLISERFARLYWPDESPLGRRVSYDNRWWTIVGIVGDVRHGSLDEEPIATYYVPYAQNPWTGMTLVAGTAVDPASLLEQLRDAVFSADPGFVVTGTHTMHSLVSDSAAEERYRALAIMVFAIVAALLAAIGIFGVTARTVARRAPEMGVRLALGARVRSLTRMIVGGNLLIAAGGVVAGIVGAAWATRLLAGFLFGIRPSDPVTYIAVAMLLLGSTVLASWLAARRIAGLDPVQVLRAQ